MLREVFLAFFYIIFTWRKRCTLTLFLEMDFVLGRAEEKRDQRRWKNKRLNGLRRRERNKEREKEEKEKTETWVKKSNSVGLSKPPLLPTLGWNRD